MAYLDTQLESLLSSAVGDDPSLVRELRQAFLTSAEDHLKALAQAPTAPEWHMAAWRFKGLCASFGIEDLAALAEQATQAPRGDPSILRKMRTALTAIAELD